MLVQNQYELNVALLSDKEFTVSSVESDLLYARFYTGTLILEGQTYLHAIEVRKIVASGSVRLVADDVDYMSLTDQANASVSDVRELVVLGSARAECDRDTNVWSFNNSRVMAMGNTVAWAAGSSVVHATEDARVSARDDAHIYAQGSSQVLAWANAYVQVEDSAHAVLDGMAMCHAYNRSTVEAHGTSTVHAWDYCTVTAGPNVTVYLHDRTARVTGGNVIEAYDSDSLDHRGVAPEVWVDIHSVVTDGDYAVLYTFVPDNYVSGELFKEPVKWEPGKTVEAYSWDPLRGKGLQLYSNPVRARSWLPNDVGHLLKIRVPVKDILPQEEGMCLVPSCEVLSEIDYDGSVKAWG